MNYKPDEAKRVMSALYLTVDEDVEEYCGDCGETEEWCICDEDEDEWTF